MTTLTARLARRERVLAWMREQAGIVCASDISIALGIHYRTTCRDLLALEEMRLVEWIGRTRAQTRAPGLWRAR